MELDEENDTNCESGEREKRCPCRAIDCVLLFISLCVTGIFILVLVHMYMSVQVAYEYEQPEELYLQTEPFYALEHFPGFKIAFVGLIVNVIIAEITLRIEPVCKILIASSVSSSLMLFYWINVYQVIHDPLWDKGGIVGRTGYILYLLSVLLWTVISALRFCCSKLRRRTC